MVRLVKRKSAIKLMGVFLAWVLLQVGCSSAPGTTRVVVIYTSVDQPYSEPISTTFERATAIQVKAIYDIEAAKTTGLVNRIIAEKNHPQANVFWNSEIIQTVCLQEKGILQSYNSPQAEGIPIEFRDPESFWTGNAARARVIILNTDLAEQSEEIDSIQDFLDPKTSPHSIRTFYG